jgi:hypothetical protein
MLVWFEHLPTRKQTVCFRPRLCGKRRWFAFLRAEAGRKRAPHVSGVTGLSGCTLGACCAARLVLWTVAGGSGSAGPHRGDQWCDADDVHHPL